MTRITVLAASLVVLAGGAVAFAAWLDFSLSPDESLDPHRVGFGVAAAFAAAFCAEAFWQLWLAGRGRAGFFGATISFGLAVLALLVLIAVAFASRLGG